MCAALLERSGVRSALGQANRIDGWRACLVLRCTGSAATTTTVCHHRHTLHEYTLAPGCELLMASKRRPPLASRQPAAAIRPIDMSLATGVPSSGRAPSVWPSLTPGRFDRWQRFDGGLPPELRAVTEAVNSLDSDSRWQRPRATALWTWVLGIAMPNAAFFVMVAPALVAAGVQNVPIAIAVLFVLSSVLMVLTSCTNPGVVSRPAVRREKKEMPTHVLVAGIRQPYKYCPVCEMGRPPRTSHCRETDRCVEKWDHYCPWVGTAVGRRNYRWFVFFITSALCLALGVAFGALQHLVMVISTLRHDVSASSPPPPLAPPHYVSRSPPTSLFDSWPVALHAAVMAPASCMLLAYGVVVSFLLAMLVAYHTYLIATNQTTYENVRAPHTHTCNRRAPTTVSPTHQRRSDPGPDLTLSACLVLGTRHVVGARQQPI